MIDWEQLTEWSNLLEAFHGAAKLKRSRPDIALFEWDFESRLAALQQSLLSGSYAPGAYRRFFVHEGKRRLIAAAPFPDRVVHHALMNVISDRFERSFVDESFANRIGKGNHEALRRAADCTRQFRYFLPIDLQQYFAAVDHEILRSRLWKKVFCIETRELISKILESGLGLFDEEFRMRWFEGDDLFAAARPRGLPIGNLTSQSWANVYLNEFDHFVKRELRCKGYIRYVDDMLFFHDDLRELHRWLPEIKARLARHRMTVHPGAHPKPVTEGVPFLGFITFPTHTRIKNRKAWHFHRKYRKMSRQCRDRELPAEEVTRRAVSWVAHASHGDTWRLRESIFSETF